jgi:peptidoglycan/xylan/chitin deacetylase (PgdA/CDA1 family)
VKGSAPGIFLVALLLLPGCAIREIQPVPPQPVPSKVPAPPRKAEPSFERIFPEFAAVVAGEGDTFASLAARYLGDPGMNWFVEEFNGIRKITPGAAVVIPLAPFDPLGVTGEAYQTVPVLCYHKFSKTTSDKMTVTEDSFEAQMRFLKVNGYQVIPLDRLFDFLDGKAQIPKKSVVVTIDDGWRSTYEIAYPILRKYGYPATLFVYTDFVGGGANALTWEMIAELSRNGVDIQGHTKTHRNLPASAASRSTILDSSRRKSRLTRIINKHLKKEVRYRHPYGDTNHLSSPSSPRVSAFTGAWGTFFTPAYGSTGRSSTEAMTVDSRELVIASGKALH